MREHGFSALLDDALKPEGLGLIYRSYDIVGDIAVIRVPEKLKRHSAAIAEAIMRFNRHVKAVWRQASAVDGEFRLRNLKHIAGEKRTVTIYREHGCIFKVDLRKCYFSPRLSFERMRIARLVKPREVVINMFAGVGCFSIAIAKHSEAEHIYSIDVNPAAFHYMRENILLNKVLNRVIPLKGDAENIITERLRETADRVLMPLPEKAYEYLEIAVESLKPKGGWIHYYSFEHARKNENPLEKTRTKVAEKLSKMNIEFTIPFSRVVRDTGPNWQQTVLDIQIQRTHDIQANLLCFKTSLTSVEGGI